MRVRNFRAVALLVAMMVSGAAGCEAAPAAARTAQSKAAAKAPVPPFQRPAALMPAHRIVAYYGNPLSKRMGIMGALPPAKMLARLAEQAAEYQRADTLVTVLPALELIATVAQASAGRDGMYRARIRDSVIESVARLADEKGYLLFLDVQIGRSSLDKEVAGLIPFLRRPNVHLAIDPEFDMPKAGVPGKAIGTTDAAEINGVIQTLADIVRQDSLPPKILVIHRFTRRMVTNSARIAPDSLVQVVIHMDGFGPPSRKRVSYKAFVHDEPVQFAGFKLFYSKDRPLMSAAQVIGLDPTPHFITYQ